MGWQPSGTQGRHGSPAPLIQTHCVDLAVLDAEQNPESKASGADMALHLAQRGIEIEVHHMRPRKRSVAEAVLAHARHGDSDLLVFGAHNHPKNREALDGSVLLELMSNTTVPLLVVH